MLHWPCVECHDGCMGGLPKNINSDDSISTGDQSVEEGNLFRYIRSRCTVNEMFVSIEFKVSWKAETSSFVMIQKLSSTYRFQILGGRNELLIADSSISSMQRLATTRLTGLPIAQP